MILDDGPSSEIKIVIAGNAAVDLTFVVEHYPGANDKCSAIGFTRRPGGQGVNMAIASARLGVSCALVTKVGADDDGAFVVAELARHGVRTDGIVRETGGRTPIVSIIVDQAQDTRACVHDKTGLTPLSADETELGLAKGAQVILVDGRFPQVCRALAELARNEGARVVATVERITDDIRALSSVADVLIMPSSLVETMHPSAGTIEASRSTRNELGAPTAIVTLGAKGCVVIDEIGTHQLDGYSAEVVDSVGAGDAFAAAVTLGLAWGWPAVIAADFANYVGARACEGTSDRWSGIPERPTKEEARALISRLS